ncbi:MAG: alginate export family protein, partial [Alphaproteobacteria bacterium]|nr:alginate export family protein [Alphaproteobacteria bacterium]
VAAGAGFAQSASAQDLAVKPLADLRLRYESVDQQGLAQPEADAVTARLRAGVEARTGPLSALVEGQGTLRLAGNAFDGLTGAANRPLIADPENVALYRAQIAYRAPSFAVTAGRQRIMLDDERFVGGVGFRQNGQTFDAVRAEWTGLPGLRADVSYVWQVRTIWGVDGTGARPRSIDGDNILASLSAKTPLGTLTGFGYLVDQDEAGVQGYRLSSQSYGARFSGAQKLSANTKLGYAFSYARQSDYRRNPNDYTADYWLADLILDLSTLKLNAGYEVLGASDGTALTSFQTPLGTNFKFQGWADKFLATPPNGVRDLYAGASYGWQGVTVQAAFHRFESDRLDQHYGDEINLLASVKRKKTTISARFAHYDAKTFATDTSKFWLQLDWAL